MKVVCYISTRYFRINRGNTKMLLVNRINKLVDDMFYLRTMGEGLTYQINFLVSEDLYRSKLIDNLDIFDVVNNQIRDPEKAAILYKSFENSVPQANYKYSKMLLQCIYDEFTDTCATAWNPNWEQRKRDSQKYMDFDKFDLLIDVSKDGVRFFRQVLGNYPGTEDSFVKACRTLYDNCVFSDNCIQSLCKDEMYLRLIPRKLVYYLSCLNDCFLTYVTNNPQLSKNTLLEGFAIAYSLDKKGSLESQKNKSHVLFDFVINSDEPQKTKKVYCNPHLKMKGEDSNYKGKRKKGLEPRIYFNYEETIFGQNKILVGAMGAHA